MNTKTTVIGILVVATIVATGGYYAYQSSHLDTQPANPAEITVDIPKTEPVSTLAIPQKEVIKPNQERATEISQSLAAMRTRQRQREIQIEAARQLVHAPVAVPDLPDVERLLNTPNPTQKNPLETRSIPAQGPTLPPDVMNKFTQETGLTQAEIEQAMNP